ncbi:MAG: acetolactate synthase small subunit [Desulfovibrio sp.]|jgi:acetolactate synthase-1/3 small subunit|nr:acetolactate synthase small subunit [Desulfovibrio sp.]
MQRHVLSVLVDNEPGVLSRVAGLFSGRGFNIHSLNVAPTLEEGVSHMTITTFGEGAILEQIMKQLHKIVSVIKVMDFSDCQAVEREMMIVKVQAEGPMRGEILRTVEIFRCKVIDVSHNEMTIEATGNHEKLEAITSLLQRFGIKELAQTGSVAMRRSKKQTD